MSGLGIPPGFGVAGSGSSPHVVHPTRKKSKSTRVVRPKPQVVRPMPAAAMGAAGLGASAGLGAMRPPLAAGMMNPGIVNPGIVPGAIPGMPGMGIPGMGIPGMGVPGMGMPGMGMQGASPLSGMRNPQLNATNQSGLNPGGSPLNQSVTNANSYRAHGAPVLPFGGAFGGMPPYMPGAYGGCPIHDSYSGSAWSGYGYGTYPYQEGGIKGFFKRMLGMY